MSIRKLRAGRVPRITAAEFIGERGTIFWNESTGEFRLSDGVTPGGSRVGFPIASPTEIGGIKLGPGVILNNDNQVIIDSTGLSFNFGDFQATTPPDGAATLQAINTNQDIAIVTNGTGVINMVGDFHIHRTQDYDPSQADADGAVFAVKGDGQIQMKVPLSDVSTAALEIIGNDSGIFFPPDQTGVILHITGNSGLVSRNYFDANANYALLAGRRYNGPQNNPTRVLAGEVIMRVVGQAATQATTERAAFQTFGPARIEFRATEDQYPTAQGGEIRMYATPNGSAASATTTLVATFNATTGLTATKFVGPLTGNVTGKADTAGNADTVTNGVYTNGSYANPTWITSLAASKVGLGNVTNESKATMFTSPTFTGTVAGVTKTMVGLSAVENTALSTSTHYIGTTSITYNRASASQSLSGVSIDGTAGSVAAANITGTILASNVVTSSLTTVGTLGSLAVTGAVQAGSLYGKLYRTVRDAGTIATGGTLTVDFSTDAIVYCVWGDGLNIAYQNYVVGRVVKVMASKTAGTGTDSISLDGVTAGQVSSGNTSITANAGATVFMEFISTTTSVGGVFIKL